LLRGAPKRNAEETPLRLLSKHASDLIPVLDEEAAGCRFCHPDHSRRSLTYGNAVSCARCSIPHRSPRRPRGEQVECRRHRDRQKNNSRPARRSRPRGTAGSIQGTVILRQQRRGLSGPDFRQPGITDDPKSQARPLRTVAERPLGADPVDPSALNSHERSCLSTVRRPSCGTPCGVRPTASTTRGQQRS